MGRDRSKEYISLFAKAAVSSDKFIFTYITSSFCLSWLNFAKIVCFSEKTKTYHRS